MTMLDLVRLLRKNLLVLLVCLLAGIAAAAVWTFTRPTTYHAQSVGLVVAGDTTSVSSATTGDLLAQSRADSYLQLLGTRAVAARVQAELGPKGIVPGGYWAARVPGTAFIQVNASAATAESAQATADAALRGLIAEALRMETYSQAQQGAPDEDLAKLTSIHILAYEPAVTPSAPERPELNRNLALGALAGLVVGLAFVLIRRQLDVKVRTQADVEELTGHSVLGVIPESRDLKRQRTKGQLELNGQVGEAVRKLRTNLRFVHVDDPLRAMVVTSANPGEGKSTIASNLARLAALSGQPVVLIDCDLRRPVQAAIFDVDSSVGLSQVLAGDIGVADAIIDTDVPGLRLLPAGRIPPNPSELVGSRKMAELIDELSRDAMVIIDAPPMLAVTDASLLSAATDGALFVTVSGKTPKEQLRLCRQQLDMVHSQMLGTVLNRVPKRTFGDTVYGYSSYSSRNAAYYQVPAAGLPPAPTSLQTSSSGRDSVQPDSDLEVTAIHRNGAVRGPATQETDTAHLDIYRAESASSPARARRGVQLDDNTLN